MRKLHPTFSPNYSPVLGKVSRRVERGEDEVVELPLAYYALLSSKETQRYASVLKAIIQAVDRVGIRNCVPQLLMSDFELSIINACQQIFLDLPISLCFSYLMQSLCRKIQEKGI